MSRSLQSYPEDQRMRVAERRLKDERALRGNGFWAAKAFYDKKGMRYPGKMGQAQEAGLRIALAMKGYKVNEDGSFHTDRDETPHFKRRHQNDDSGAGGGRGKSPRRGNRPTGNSPRQENRRRVRVPGMQSGSPHMGGRPKSRQGFGGKQVNRNFKPHENKMRVVR